MNFKYSKHVTLYFATVFIWIITVLIKLKYNGLIFGFDFGLYHPDGALYTTRTLDWSGYTETEAAKIVSNWYSNHAFKFNNLEPSGLYYGNHPLYREYSTRILYPFLSIPFVKLFGVQGMLIVPAFSLLITMLVVLKIGIALNKTLISLLIITAISSSPTVLRWMVVNTTDALLVGLFSIVALYLVKRVPSPRWNVIFGGLIILTGLTRFSTLFWFAIALVSLLQGKVKKFTFILAVSVIVLIPALLTNSSNSFLAVEAQRSLWQRFLLYPLYLIKITFYEFAELFVLDRVLFFMCILSLFLAYKHFYKVSSRYLIFMFFAGLLTGALNGTIGVNFRYQLPILAFMCWSLIDNIDFSLKRFLKPQ